MPPQEMPTELDLEILPFSSYDLIIDARTEKEFADDHIPGAVNLPALDEKEYEEVGEIALSQSSKAHAIGVSCAMKRVGDHVGRMAGKPAAKSVLVYCLRGGKRSLVWSCALKALDIQAKVLPGGWKSYRRWVVASLNRLFTHFEYRLIAGEMGSGQEQLLQALAEEGAQILDLGALGGRHGMPISWMGGAEQPSQRLFESKLLDAMRGLSSDTPVWVVNWNSRVGSLTVPQVLQECLRRSKTIELAAPLGVRVEELMRVHGSRMDLLHEMAKRMRESGRVKLDGAVFEKWERDAKEGQHQLVLEEMLTNFFDASYRERREQLKIDDAQVVAIKSLKQSALRRTARMLMLDNQKRPMGRGSRT